jgi:hypothetical protein
MVEEGWGLTLVEAAGLFSDPKINDLTDPAEKIRVLVESQVTRAAKVVVLNVFAHEIGDTWELIPVSNIAQDNGIHKKE